MELQGADRIIPGYSISPQSQILLGLVRKFQNPDPRESWLLKLLIKYSNKTTYIVNIKWQVGNYFCSRHMPGSQGCGSMTNSRSNRILIMRILVLSNQDCSLRDEVEGESKAGWSSRVPGVWKGKMGRWKQGRAWHVIQVTTLI